MHKGAPLSLSFVREYPQIPKNSAAVAERAKELEEKHTAEQVAAAVAAGGVSGGAEGLETSEGAAMKVNVTLDPGCCWNICACCNLC